MNESDAFILMTEWNQFRNLEIIKTKRMLKTLILFDFRNIYERKILEAMGFSYYGVGR